MRRFFLACKPCIRSLRSKIAVFAIAMLCSACAPGSGWTPFQGALFQPAQLFSEDTDVRGLRVNVLYGGSANLSGVDVGLVGSAEAVGGIQSSLVNISEELVGVQIAGVHNRSERVVGLQITPLVNEAYDLTGLQTGLLNFNRGGRGWQAGLLNSNRAESLGSWQAGFLNINRGGLGWQIGFLNINRGGQGLQIGPLNFNKGGWLPFFPIVNFGLGSAPEESTASED